MSDNMGPQFLHYSNHEFKPGDEVIPPNERGVKSPNARYKDYSGDHVYIAHPDSQQDPYFHLAWGKHAYSVEPLGPVEQDPEHDPREPDDVWRERGSWQYMAPRARVLGLHHTTEPPEGHRY